MIFPQWSLWLNKTNLPRWRLNRSLILWGIFTLNVIAFLGYGEHDEYKVMGLAPYGDGSLYQAQFKRFYELLPNGDYTIHTERILELYNVLTPRVRGSEFTQLHKDLAAALQLALEDIIFHIFTAFSHCNRLYPFGSRRRCRSKQ